jgi:hypothetical protein
MLCEKRTTHGHGRGFAEGVEAAEVGLDAVPQADQLLAHVLEGEQVAVGTGVRTHTHTHTHMRVSDTKTCTKA